MCNPRNISVEFTKKISQYEELSKITWDHTIYPSGIKNHEVILYFPEKNTIYYGNLSSGYLVDIAEDTLKVVKYIVT